MKFDEIDLLGGAHEKIDAVGAGLDLGPIRNRVREEYRLVRAASGLGSVVAEVARNNNGWAFSEDDLVRERLAENMGTASDSEVMSLNVNCRL